MIHGPMGHTYFEPEAAVLLSSLPGCGVQGLFDFLPICNVRTLVPQIRTVEGEATASSSTQCLGGQATAANFCCCSWILSKPESALMPTPCNLSAVLQCNLSHG